MRPMPLSPALRTRRAERRDPLCGRRSAGDTRRHAVAWGCERTRSLDYGQCNVPSALSGVTAIAAANSHSLALKSDGTVVAWGCGAWQLRGSAACRAGSPA